MLSYLRQLFSDSVLALLLWALIVPFRKSSLGGYARWWPLAAMWAS
jgi:hypothetical protein